MSTPIVDLTIATTHPAYGDERTEQWPVDVFDDGYGRLFYMPAHVGDAVDGSTDVVAVQDHDCPGAGCTVDEIDLPGQRREAADA